MQLVKIFMEQNNGLFGVGHRKKCSGPFLVFNFTLTPITPITLYGFGLLVAIVGLLCPLASQAASFDCAKAVTKVEKMICGDAELSRLDEVLGHAYSEAREKAADTAVLKGEQRAWLRERNYCKDTACLRDQYQQRLAYLNQLLPVLATISPPDISEFYVDCDKALSKAERIICRQDGSPLEQDWLGNLDKDMRPELQWALMRSKDRRKVLDSQRQWQKQERDTCVDVLSCVDVYSKRRMELRAMWERPGQCYALKPLSDSNERPRLDVGGNVQPIEPVCQAMEENLNQFCDQPPMVCGLKVAPSFIQLITFPEWSKLDPEANRALIDEFIRAPLQVESRLNELKEKIWQEERLKIEGAFADKRLNFSKTKLDLYNLGKAQAAYRLDYGTCFIDNPYLNDKNAWAVPLRGAPVQIHYGPEIIEQIFQHNFDFVAERAPVLGEVMIYGGKTYSYIMFGFSGSGKSGGGNWLYINQHGRWTNPVDNTVSLHMSNICRFDYNPIQEGDK